MHRNSLPIAALFLLSSSCTETATPAASTSTSTSTAPAATAEPAASGDALSFTHDARSLVETDVGEPTSFKKSVALEDGLEVEVLGTTATAKDGGRYLLETTLRVADGKGWKLKAAPSGGPINVGPGTGGDVVMQHGYLVEQRTKTLKGEQMYATMVNVRADGQATRE